MLAARSAKTVETTSDVLRLTPREPGIALLGSAKIRSYRISYRERFREFNIDSAVSTGVGKLIADPNDGRALAEIKL
jgi:hypothetical protein